MSSKRPCVPDTCVMLDMGKGDDGTPPDDVTNQEEWEASVALLERLLDPDGDLVVAVSNATLREWEQKNVTARTYVRSLFHLGRISVVKARRINGGQRRDLTRHIEGEDVCFVLTAAELTATRPWKRYLVTRDPRSCQSPAKRYVKRAYGVHIRRASEFMEVLDDLDRQV